MRENGGECYTYTDQKETADVLVSVIGTDTRGLLIFKNLEFTLKGELPHGKKEIFKLANVLTNPISPSRAKGTALALKNILCK